MLKDPGFWLAASGGQAGGSGQPATYQPASYGPPPVAPCYPGPQSLTLYPTPSRGHWISKNIDVGAIIVLEDGSAWKIDPPDKVYSAL